MGVGDSYFFAMMFFFKCSPMSKSENLCSATNTGSSVVTTVLFINLEISASVSPNTPNPPRRAPPPRLPPLPPPKLGRLPYPPRDGKRFAPRLAGALWCDPKERENCFPAGRLLLLL